MNENCMRSGNEEDYSSCVSVSGVCQWLWRGYNQAEILAKLLGEYWKLPVDTDILRKRKDTGAQKELDRTERRRNLQEAFVAESDRQYESVLLVDDVYTTGSTVDAAASALRACGIYEIFFTAICIGHGDMVY